MSNAESGVDAFPIIGGFLVLLPGPATGLLVDAVDQRGSRLDESCSAFFWILHPNRGAPGVLNATAFFFNRSWQRDFAGAIYGEIFYGLGPRSCQMGRSLE